MWLYLALILSLFSGASDEEISLLEAVPSDTCLTLSLKSLGAIRTSWKDSDLKGFLDDPEVKPLMEKLDSLVSVEMDDEEVENFDLLSRFYHSISDDVVLFTTDFDPASERFGAALLVEPGEGRDEFDACFTELKDFFYKDEKIAECSSESYNDVDLDIFDNPEEGKDQGRLILGDTGRVAFFIFNFDSERCLKSARVIIDDLAGESERETLADNELFQHAREKSGGIRGFEFFMNLKAIVAQLPDLEDIAFVGLNDLRSLYFTANLGESDSLKSAFYFNIEGKGLIRELLDGLTGEPPMEFLKLVPAEAVQYSISRLDLAGMYELGMQTLKEQNEGQYNTFKMLIEGMFTMQTGLQLKQDLLDQLDGRLGSFALKRTEKEDKAMTANAGSGIPSTLTDLYIIGIHDPAALQAGIDTALTKQQMMGSLKKEEFQGEKIYSLQILDPCFKPTWAFTGDAVVFSFFPSQVRAFLRLHGSADNKTVELPDSMKELMEEHSPYTGLSMVNLSNSLTIMSKAIKDMMTQASYPGVEEWIKLIPSRNVIDRHFSGDAGTVIVVDDEGALWVSELF